MPATTKGAWKLQDVRDALLANEWVTYSTSGDPNTLWAWGYNVYGQLGDGTKTYRSSPVQIPGTSWNDITSRGLHSLARKTDGTLWAWGYNVFGQLGDNTTTYRSSPVQVPGTSWNDITGGANHSLARKTDGTLWSWGYNIYGDLGVILKRMVLNPWIILPG